DGDAVLCPEGEGIRGDDGEHQAEESAGQPVAQPLRGDDDGEHAERDAERPEVDVAELAEEIADLIDGGGPSTGDTEDDGELPGDDADGNPGEDPGDDGCREQLRDPPQPDEADGD